MFTLFYIGFAIVVLGLGTVWLLLVNDRKNSSAAETPSPSPKGKETTAQLLNRVGLVKETPTAEIAEDDKENFLTKILNSLPFLKKQEDLEEIAEPLEPPRPTLSQKISVPLQQSPSLTGTLSIKSTPQAPPEQMTVAKDTSVEFQTWQAAQFKEKLDKLETLLNEKNQTLEKVEKELASEIRNHKEFNKIKDALEKELKDSKVRTRDLQIELTSAQTESAGFKNRVNQLEVKVTKLEKTITELEHAALDKDHKIQELTKKLQMNESALKTISEAKTAAHSVPPETAGQPGEETTIPTPVTPASAPTESTAAEPSHTDDKGPTRQESLKHFLKHLEDPPPSAVSETMPDSTIPAEAPQSETPVEAPDSPTPDQPYIKLPPDILQNQPNKDTTEPDQNLSTEKQKPKTQEPDSDQPTHTPPNNPE